jgi:hypothetical protein
MAETCSTIELNPAAVEKPKVVAISAPPLEVEA